MSVSAPQGLVALRSDRIAAREDVALNFFTRLLSSTEVEVSYCPQISPEVIIMTTLQLPDGELAGQPAAYWTGVAYESLIAFTRARQADFGFTQPQFWLLRNLSPRDLLPHDGGMTVPELEQAMSSYLRTEDDLSAEAAALLQRGWIARDEKDRLSITKAGEDARLRFKQHAPVIRALIHKGIDDADYIVALKVLRQLIRNTGGSA